ncbi:Alkane 1-monooxygenase 2 [Alcanivorax sp. ALC70]|nr:Alkane 1-monooxygenase 2 [Alcanivorax sp. ALC70]
MLFGWQGVLFFCAQSFVAAFTLEVINYIEHYGLHRRVKDNGRYERVTPAHSWNSNYLLTNLALFQLQRHSDHHAYAKRRYQVLRHYEESPQLPGGYAAMYVLALFPPLWKKVMNPRWKPTTRARWTSCSATAAGSTTSPDSVFDALPAPAPDWVPGFSLAVPIASRTGA